jgi:flavin-dependent dehydrogenase
MFDVCIVGAGLSGAYAANLLGRLGGMSVTAGGGEDRTID